MLSGLLQRYKQMPQPARWALGFGTIILGLNLLGVALDALYGGAASGPGSSTYTTGSEGAAAYAELLRRDDREVVALRRAPSEVELDPAAALFVLSAPDVGSSDAEALAAFVQAGGRLIVSVDEPARWLSELMPSAPTWVAGGPTDSEALVPVAETSGVSSVVGAGGGSWEPGSALPILGDGTVSAAIAASGDGSIVFLADPTVLHNGFLDRSDNAAFGMAIAGDRERVMFAETFHGYEEATGFGALPAAGRAAIFLLLVGVLMVMLAYGRRFGPPDRIRRDFPPPRRAYVDALASSLAKMKDPHEVVGPLRSRARSALARRLHVANHVSDDELLAVASRHGVERDAQTLLRPVRNQDDLVHFGQVAIRTIRGLH